jgi:putative membrane protein
VPSFVEYLPAVNASLNGTAAVLLVIGLVLIKRRHEVAHKWVMLTAFAVSMVFLACYLTYHALKTWHTQFTGPAPVRTVYLVILITHVVLAATVPFLAGTTLWLGLQDRRAAHRRWANRTFPIWLYVSITGVIIYAMLYHLYPPEKIADTIVPAATDAEPQH